LLLSIALHALHHGPCKPPATFGLQPPILAFTDSSRSIQRKFPQVSAIVAESLGTAQADRGPLTAATLPRVGDHLGVLHVLLTAPHEVMFLQALALYNVPFLVHYWPI
jgi:hypothetical protein